MTRLPGLKKLLLHRMYIRTDIIKGYVALAAIDEMPVAGIQLLLSNDLAGGSVNSVIVTEQPTMDESQGEDLSLFPVCAVPRSVARQIVSGRHHTKL